jgi:hypothetical protein
MVTVVLDEEERHTLVNLLTLEIEASRFPLSERTERLKRIRATLLDEHSEPSG